MSICPAETMEGNEHPSGMRVIAGPVLGIALAILAMVVLAIA